MDEDCIYPNEELPDIDETWISATSTYNYMLKDPLLDWLKYNKKNIESHYKSCCDITLEDNDNFTKYIMEQGKIFEQKIIKLVVKKFSPQRVKDFGDFPSARDPKSVDVTIQAMKSGYPIIHSGVLHNFIDKTFGIPDLLVRSDWINKLVENQVLSDEEESIPAVNFGTNWHYRIVDIKFTCLLLRADGTHILNSGSFPAYKSQLLIYNQALGLIQGYTPDKAYILGRRWKYTHNGENYSNNSCFDKLGVINYTTIDEKYIQLTKNALEWIRECRSSAASNWNIFKYPLIRKELYPNMCNKYDYPWHQIKEKIAFDNKELTCLWMVGVKNRNIALDNNIYRYSDSRCTSSTLGIGGEKISPILNAIIKINKSSCKDLILPYYISNNYCNWQCPNTVEFFIDFETFNGVCTSIKHLPIANTLNMIFMIGVGYIVPDSHKWHFKSFTADLMTIHEEARICRDFYEFVQMICKRYNVKNPSLFHWSQIESNMWMDSMDRYNILSDNWNWVDMLKIFKSEPITIKGCMSYGLKEVASTFNKHGFIQTKWDTKSICSNGSSAMLFAYRAHKIAYEHKMSMVNTDIMKEIIKYNEVDVKVIYEIITFLRQKHVKPVKQITKKRKRKE